MEKNQKTAPNLETALFLASICGQAYTQFKNIDSGFYYLPSGYEHVATLFAHQSNKAKDRFGFVITNPDCSIISFRGSSTSVDWIHDFKAQQIPFPYVSNVGATHKGFTEIYCTLRESVFEAIQQLSENKPLFITGHSLGGALATLAAMDIMCNSHIRNVIVYTFASPRVGDPQFVKQYNYIVPTHWRIQNKHDIVPHMPTLVYYSTHTEQNYFYLHVKGEVLRQFKQSSVSANHLLQSYFQDLACDLPDIAAQLCRSPLGFCPEYIPVSVVGNEE